MRRAALLLLTILACLGAGCNVAPPAACSAADIACNPLRAALLAAAGAEEVFLGSGVAHDDCSIQRSEDGVNWTELFYQSFNCTVATGIERGNDVYVAVGGEGSSSTCYIFFSRDGENWDTLSCPANAGYLQDLIFVNGQFVAVGVPNPTAATIVTSTDGQNWSFHSAGLTIQLNSLTFANGQYYIGTSSGVYTVTDLDASASLVGTTVGQNIDRIRATDGGRIFAASGTGTSYYSLDGTTFAAATILTSAANGEKPYAIAPFGDGFMALGGITAAGGDCYADYASDAVNWFGGALHDSYCTVDPPLFYYPLMLGQAGSLYFASGVELSSSNPDRPYVSRAVDPLETNGDGWLTAPTDVGIAAITVR